MLVLYTAELNALWVCRQLLPGRLVSDVLHTAILGYALSLYKKERKMFSIVFVRCK